MLTADEAAKIAAATFIERHKFGNGTAIPFRNAPAGVRPMAWQQVHASHIAQAQVCLTCGEVIWDTCYVDNSVPQRFIHEGCPVPDR